VLHHCEENVKLKLIHKDFYSDEDTPVGVTEWMCSDVFDFRQFQSFPINAKDLFRF
jgi:hypothetical protein